LIYDNLPVAIRKVLRGKGRIEQEALVNLLVKKGLISKEELLEEIKKVGAKQGRTENGDKN